MPIYEYQCDKCGQAMEKMRKFSDPPLTVCPNCGGALKKLISDCTFHLKGSGWYVTDYGGRNSQKEQGSDKGEKKKEKNAGKEKSKETKTSGVKEE